MSKFIVFEGFQAIVLLSPACVRPAPSSVSHQRPVYEEQDSSDAANGHGCRGTCRRPMIALRYHRDDGR